MITKAQATKRLGPHQWGHDQFESVHYNNSDGTPSRWRRNGATKTWKTRPADFKIPVKHGLYDYGYIDQDNAADFKVAK